MRVEQANTTMKQPQVQLTQLGLQLTKSGDNYAPQFSDDGHKVLFISQKRSMHQQAQVYLFDLDSLKEKRLTYQNGQASEALFKGNDFIYTSSTDEDKESAQYFSSSKNQDNPFSNSEIYQSNLSGTHIQRLTKHPGFDGRIFLNKKNNLFFTRQDKDQFALWHMLLHDGAQKSDATLVIELPKDQSFTLAEILLSPSMKNIAWINNEKIFAMNNKGLNATTIKNATALDLPPGKYRNLFWWDENKIIFSAQATSEAPSKLQKRFQIYMYDIEKKCLSVWIENTNGDLTDFTASNDKSSVAFANQSSNSDERHIFYLKTPALPTACL